MTDAPRRPWVLLATDAERVRAVLEPLSAVLSGMLTDSAERLECHAGFCAGTLSGAAGAGVPELTSVHQIAPGEQEDPDADSADAGHAIGDTGWRGRWRRLRTRGAPSASSTGGWSVEQVHARLEQDPWVRQVLTDPGCVLTLDRAMDDAVQGLLPAAAVQLRSDVIDATTLLLTRIREVRAESGREAVARFTDRMAALLPPDLGPGGRSGLDAEIATARIVCAPTDAEAPPEAELARAARLAMAGADEAWRQGRGLEAVQRFTAAAEVVFHRERHAEALSSPLVTSTAEHLSAVLASGMYQDLVCPPGRDSSQHPVAAGVSGTPTVLVLEGSYGGGFTAAVVEALGSHAQVTPLALGATYRPLAGKMVNADAIRAVAATSAAAGRPADLSLTDAEQAASAELTHAIDAADVVFADWADRSAVWASRRLRPSQQMVLRVHSLDVFDLWIHLIDWRGVRAVIAVSPPLARIVEGILQARGVQVPVYVVPNLVRPREFALPKTDDARHTLGMVGWGRRVKDVLWTIELLRRDPQRRLVLIGPGVSGGLTERSHRYGKAIRRALRDPQVADRIEVVGRTDDVAGHLRAVGVIVSASRRESWHMGLVEGALSAAVPVVRNWPLVAPVGGPRTIFPPDWVVDDLQAADERIRTVTGSPATWERERQDARAQAEKLFDRAGVAQRYREVILGGGGGGGGRAGPPS